jgi:low temperature requirement protein LtrA
MASGGTRTKATLHAPEAQPVTFVELFFDLVFVFAVTQVTVLTAHHLDLAGVARSGVIFWLIWWAWTQFTWTLNPADTQHGLVRLCTLAATSAAFIMAASVPGAFEQDALWFAIPYVVIRLLGMGMQVRVDQERAASAGQPGISMRWVYVSLVGLVVVLAGAIADPSVRPWLWLLAIVVDLLAASAASNTAWDLDPAHFSERHGLFVIIALGESLIVAAGAVAEDERTADLVLAAGASLLVACLLWWTYFGWLKEVLEERFAEAEPVQLGPLARDAYSLGHFPLICGIIGFAVAVEEIVLHPERAAEAPVLASLAIGIALFVCSTAWSFWRITGQLLTARLVVTALTVAGVFAVGRADPVWPLLVVAAGLVAIIAAEGRHHRRSRPATLHLEAPAP